MHHSILLTSFIWFLVIVISVLIETEISVRVTFHFDNFKTEQISWNTIWKAEEQSIFWKEIAWQELFCLQN